MRDSEWSFGIVQGNCLGFLSASHILAGDSAKSIQSVFLSLPAPLINKIVLGAKGPSCDKSPLPDLGTSRASLLQIHVLNPVHPVYQHVSPRIAVEPP